MDNLVNALDKKKFDIIFHEAVVIDLDFSNWDKYVRLVVVGLSIPVRTQESYALYRVDFCDLEELHWKSNHLGIELESESHHCQWTIFEADLHKARSHYEVELSGVTAPSPLLQLKCGSIRISEMHKGTVDRVNPGWNRSSAPMARPGLDEMCKIIELTRGSS